jgi:transcriptional regulator with XRE-family HTH domain
MDRNGLRFQTDGMVEKKVTTRFKTPPGRPTYIRAWRKYRQLTQEQLAERAEMSPGNLSQLENQKQDYTRSTLERLAEALNCDPVDLLIRDPNDPEGIWSLWDQAKPAQKRQIIGVIEGLLRASGE